MKAELSRGFSRKLAKRVGRFQFEVGILQDKPHYEPEAHGLFEEPKLKAYAGGPARKQSRILSDKSTGEILVANSERLNIDLLRRPWQEKSSDIQKFVRAFFKLVLNKGMSIRRVENLVQAVVRNPILRGEYGRNSTMTADGKGFNRLLIDTAQMFKAIRARAKRV